MTDSHSHDPKADCDAILDEYKILYDDDGVPLVAVGFISADKKERFNDGAFIRTSLIKEIKGCILTTQNSRYWLEHESEYNNAPRP